MDLKIIVDQTLKCVTDLKHILMHHIVCVMIGSHHYTQGNSFKSAKVTNIRAYAPSTIKMN